MKKTRKIIEKEIERGKKQIGWEKLSLWLNEEEIEKLRRQM